MRKIILASSSPRRREILEKSGISFSAEESGYEEDLTLKLGPHKLAEYLALQKAEAVAMRHKDGIIIGADTIVVLKNEILGKSRDKSDASKMLKKLSGSMNTVITGIAIIDASSGRKLTKSAETHVFFKKLSDNDIVDYIHTGEYRDKAGSYAVQGEGRRLIEKIEGDLGNAMGLPLDLLLKELEEFGVHPLPPWPL
ncbi:MAG TPA: nucleoside triphosphate pyrophosphatase [Candidatus Paceibacterota bacterium]